MEQHGFFFDQSRCSGCHACTVACKNWHRLSPGPVKYLRIYEYEKGSFPDLRIHYQWIPCYHCEEPACVDICPNQAISKEPKYGAVLIDGDKCDGCRLCYDVCPYGAPVFESDDPGVKAQKCNMCIDRLELGDAPVCVMSCPTRALDFGPLSALTRLHGIIRDLEDLPNSATTKPAVIFKAHNARKQLVAYDARRAANLLNTPEGAVTSGKLVIKHSSADDLMRRTRNSAG